METTIINLIYKQKVYLEMKDILIEAIGLPNVEFKFGHFL